LTGVSRPFILLSCDIQSRPDEDTANETIAAAVNQVPVSQHASTSGADDYFQTVVITSLLAILKDQSLNSHHHTVIEAIMSIFKTQGLKCVTFLPQVRLNYFEPFNLLDRQW
jgi:FKBP12-rapamycin complex-associated protein